MLKIHACKQVTLAGNPEALRMLTLLCSALLAHAGDDSLVTDRPDIAESSLVVGKGTYQLEQGVSVEGGGGSTVIGAPSLSRYGVGGNLELRLETPWVQASGGSVEFPGAAVGIKWHAPTDAASVAILAHADIGADGQVAPIVKLAWDADLPAGLELGVNVGGTTAPGFGPASALWATAVGRSVTDSLRFYVEASGDYALSAGVATVAFDGGASYLLSDDVQLDASALYGAVGGGWAAGAGVSVRFD